MRQCLVNCLVSNTTVLEKHGCHSALNLSGSEMTSGWHPSTSNLAYSKPNLLSTSPSATYFSSRVPLMCILGKNKNKANKQKTNEQETGEVICHILSKLAHQCYVKLQKVYEISFNCVISLKLHFLQKKRWKSRVPSHLKMSVVLNKNEVFLKIIA